MTAYTASKAGLIGMTQSAALDYGPAGIRCNVVCPGAVRTEMLENAMTPLANLLKTDVTGACVVDPNGAAVSSSGTRWGGAKAGSK